MDQMPVLHGRRDLLLQFSAHLTDNPKVSDTVSDRPQQDGQHHVGSVPNTAKLSVGEPDVAAGPNQHESILHKVDPQCADTQLHGT